MGRARECIQRGSQERAFHMTPPALHALDLALAHAVAAVAPSVVHVARRHGGGTGLVWAPDLVISASFHAPDRTWIGVGTAEEELDRREAEVIGSDPGTDLAVLRVAGGGLTAATVRTFRDLGDLGVGKPGARDRPPGPHRARLAAPDRGARPRDHHAPRRSARSPRRVRSPASRRAARPRSPRCSPGTSCSRSSVAVTGPDDLRTVLAARPGAQVRVMLLRAGARHEVTGALGRRA